MRYALRSLLRTPGFTFVAVLTLALGMGANTTFFSVLYGVVLHRLPFPHADELVELRNLGPALGSNNGQISLPELRDYRERQRTLAGIAAYDIGRTTLTRDDGAERVILVTISANFFPTLGVAPALGRNFNATEEQPGHDRVVVISHAVWQTHFAGARDILTRTVQLNGIEHTIVGVMPAGFAFAERDTALWKPFAFSPAATANRDDRQLATVARLAPGITLEQARVDLQRVASQLQSDLPKDYPVDARWSIGLTPLRDSQFGQMFAPLATLMTAAAAVLLIACANVAIMFLLRAAARRREIAIRLSLGAGRRHIVHQLLAESVVVCGLGAAGGLLVALGGIQLLKAFPPADIPRLHEVAINGPIAAFTFGVLLLVTGFVGLVPAFAVLKTRVIEGIAQSTRTTDSRLAIRLREILTVAEIALAVMLLVCGGLAFRSLRGLLNADVGFTTDRLLTFKTNLADRAYPDAARVNRFYDAFTARLAALPGVTGLGAVSYLPLSGESQFASFARAKDPAGIAKLTVGWRVVRGAYFETLGMSLVRGRFFTAADGPGAPLVAIVDDELARRAWPDANPIGQSVRLSSANGDEVRTVVGVVHRARHFGPGKPALPDAYVPHAQVYQRGMYTVLKTNAATEALTTSIRAALAEVDASVPMYFTATMDQRYDQALAVPRFTAGLIGAFSTLALVLAGVGIFGVTAYSVGQRVREFGIRFALGAQRAHVARLVLGRVGRLALLGAVLGATAAFYVAQLMATLLYAVEPTDGPTLLAAALVTAFTALLASLVPLTRALRVDPVEALRAQ
jgi:predicted permease